jgi:hypothetical protein
MSFGGTLPPFSASFFMTSLWSHMFMLAVSPVSRRSAIGGQFGERSS